MFDNKALAGLTHSECVGYAAQFRAQITELTNSKTRLSRSDESQIEELQAELDQVETHRERLEQKARFSGTGGRRSLAGAEIRTMAGSGGEDRLGSYVPDDDRSHGDRVLGGQRTAAMRTLDAATRDGTMQPDAAGIFERLLGTGSAPERSWTARYVEAAGSPDYLSAFQKKLADPEGARDRFSAAEVEAVRRVHEVNEYRAMSTTDTAGGFLIPAHLDPAIMLSSNGFRNPIREIARVVQVTGDIWKGVSTAGASARWAPEATEANDDSPTLGQPTVPVYKGDCFVPYSFEVEMDSPGFVSEISRVMMDSIDALWSVAFATGSGIGEPTGFVTALAAAGSSVVVAGDGSEVLDNGDPVKLQNALPPRAQANSAFAANLSTINKLRMAETASGALLYPSLQNEVPTLLGRRIHEISDMDGTVNAAATQNNYLLALGDWSRFLIADRIGTTVEVVPHLMGPNRRPTAQRGLFAWFRTGSDVLTPNSFRLLNVPTAA